MENEQGLQTWEHIERKEKGFNLNLDPHCFPCVRPKTHHIPETKMNVILRFASDF